MFFKRVKYFVVNYLIRIVAIVGEDINASPLKMLKDRRGAGGGATLSVIALADDVKSIFFCIINEFCKVIKKA